MLAEVMGRCYRAQPDQWCLLPERIRASEQHRPLKRPLSAYAELANVVRTAKFGPVVLLKVTAYEIIALAVAARCPDSGIGMYG